MMIYGYLYIGSDIKTNDSFFPNFGFECLNKIYIQTSRIQLLLF